MAALNFPTSPTVGQIYTANGKSWQWNGTAWISYNQITALNGITIDNSVIGGTTPAAGAFTTLSASSQLTLTNASNYNVYASGVGGNYFAGSVGVGTTPNASSGMTLGGTAISGTDYGFLSTRTASSATTAKLSGYTTSLITAASSFTLSNLYHYSAEFQSIGSGSTVTSQVGFIAHPALTGATNNYGFYSNIASGTNRWNFYAAGTADNYFAGAVGIGSTPTTTTRSLLIAKSATGSVNYINASLEETILSDVTSSAEGFSTYQSTQAAAFTLYNMRHFTAKQGAIGAGSTVTNQLGFVADPSLTGATNNYGFYSNIASGTGRYNFYAAGTADNYLAGSLGIGSTSLSDRSLAVGKNITGGANAYGVIGTGTVQSDVTAAYYFRTNTTTAATAFTLSALHHYHAAQGTIGSSSAVTTQYGFIAESSLTGATNNFGFYSNIASGTGRHNFYAAGTAVNYFAGNVGIGNSTPTYPLQVVTADGTAARLQVSTTSMDLSVYDASNEVRITAGRRSGTSAKAISFRTDDGSSEYERVRIDGLGNCLVISSGGLGYGTGSGGAVTQATSRTTGVTLNKTNGAITLVSAAGSTSYQSFTVTNSTVAATDTIIVNQKSGTDIYEVFVTAVAAGSFRITFATTGGTTTEQPVFNFAVLKAVAA